MLLQLEKYYPYIYNLGKGSVYVMSVTLYKIICDLHHTLQQKLFEAALLVLALPCNHLCQKQQKCFREN